MTVLLEPVVVHATKEVIASNENRRRKIGCIEPSPESERDRSFKLLGEELTDPLFEVINRVEGISPTDESDMTTVLGKIELESGIAFGNCPDLVQHLRGQKRVVNRT